MHVSPSDIRYAVVGVQLIQGKPTWGILQKGFRSRNAAHERLPETGRYVHLAQVIGYVSKHRARDAEDIAIMRDASRNPTN